MSKKSRRKKMTNHHIKNKKDGGTREAKNLILLIREKHDCWHTLFKDKTFREAARVLLRAERMKKKLDKEWERNFETNYG